MQRGSQARRRQHEDALEAAAAQFLLVYGTSLTILLGLYLGSVMSRWQAIRMDTIGNLWGNTDDVNLILAAHFPEPEWRPLRALYLRYACLAWELVFMASAGETDLEPLRRSALATEEELRDLREQPAKAQTVWTWIATLFRGIAVRHLQPPQPMPF